MKLPPVIFGTSGLGNLFVTLKDQEKCDIIGECVRLSNGNVVFDSAGKYGAGLALEVLGKCLKQLQVPPEQVTISNKLGWYRTELTTIEPTFEPGVWKDLKHDAVQKISYSGILECFEQGNELLNGYRPQMVSVHDPDEYLAGAVSDQHANTLYADIVDAYRALHQLKKEGKVQSVGVGAKDWRVIKKIAEDVPLDWVMIANSMTIKSHPQELLDFIEELKSKGVYVINSAVFHSGFLVGGDYFDYQLIEPGDNTHSSLIKWRENFFEVCNLFNVKPAEACIQFALKVPGVQSIALNTTHVKRVSENLEMAHVEMPIDFWETLLSKGLISINFFNSNIPVLKGI